LLTISAVDTLVPHGTSVSRRGNVCLVATAWALDVVSGSADRRAGCLGGECRLAFDPGRPRTLRGCRVVGGIGLQSWLRRIAPGRREVGRCRGTARLLAWSVAAFTLASLIGGLATEGWVLIAA